MYHSPLCVVGLSVYNDAAHIAEAMDSILAQSHKHFIFCVVDDGSTDGTAAIVDGFKDSRVHIIHLPENRGRPQASNIALEFALRMHTEQGAQYFFWMDGDDISLPERLEKQIAFMETHSEIDIVGSAVTFFGGAKGKMKKPSMHEAIKAQSIWGAALFNPTTCFRLQSLVNNGLCYDVGLRRVQDYGFWIDALFSSSLRMANMSESLLLYRYAERPANTWYHALATEKLLRYLGLPHDVRSCLKHAMLSCSDFASLKEAPTLGVVPLHESIQEKEHKEIAKEIEPMELVHWANTVYEAVLTYGSIHQGHFLRITHYKMEQFFAWPDLERQERKTLLKQYAGLGLGGTQDLRRLFAAG